MKSDYKHVKLFLNVCKKLVVISDDYHDVERLLLLTISLLLAVKLHDIDYCQAKYHG